jgi:hypothetical protein
MNEERPQQPWIERCAQRIRWRHMVAQEEALELAAAMHQALGGAGCPERAADELFAEQDPV